MEKNQTMRRGCPLTGGAAIRMTQDAFDRCCQAQKTEALKEQGKYGHLSKGFSFAFSSPCLTCSEPPAELTIITIDQAKIPERKPRPKQSAPLSIPAPWGKAKKSDPPQPVHIPQGHRFCLSRQAAQLSYKPIKKPAEKPQEKPNTTKAMGKLKASSSPPVDRTIFLRNGYQWMPIGKLCLAFNQRFNESQTEWAICQMLIQCRVLKDEGPRHRR